MAKTNKHKAKEQVEVIQEEDAIQTVTIIGTGIGGLLEGKEYLYPVNNAEILVNKGLANYKKDK
jgi:hypothetical protein